MKKLKFLCADYEGRKVVSLCRGIAYLEVGVLKPLIIPNGCYTHHIAFKNKKFPMGLFVADTHYHIYPWKPYKLKLG